MVLCKGEEMIISEVSATASENIGHFLVVLAFTGEDQYAGGANRVSENNRTVEVGAYFWELLAPENLTVGAPLPLWGTPYPKQSCPSVQNSSNHSECFILSSSLEKEYTRD